MLILIVKRKVDTGPFYIDRENAVCYNENTTE